MKKIRFLLLICALVIITTGCVKFNVNMDIKKDKSMDFSIIEAIDKSMTGGEINSLKEEDFDEIKKAGFTVEKYSQDNMEGFKLTKKIANIDEVSSESDVIFDISKFVEGDAEDKYIFKVVKGTDKNTYTAKIKFDASSSGMGGNMGFDTGNDEITPDEDDTLTTTGEDEPITTIGEGNETVDGETTEESETSSTTDLDDIDITKFMNNLDLSFNVNLPYGAISSNATTKNNDNKNLSWKLTATGEQYIEFTFELKNNEGSNMLLYIGIGVAALVIILVLVLVLSKKKNNNQVMPNYNVESNNIPVNNMNENVIPELERKE